MAKIWIPKSWSGTNPPASGQRVFVGGKGAGKAVYESISAGQTKRCLQSNGRGSVFYGNVSIANPGVPVYSTNINLNFAKGSASSVIAQVDGADFRLSNPLISQFTYQQINFNSDTSLQNSPITTGYFKTTKGEMTYHETANSVLSVNPNTLVSWGNLAQAKKLTVKIGAYYVTYQLTLKEQTENFVKFNIVSRNQNIPSTWRTRDNIEDYIDSVGNVVECWFNTTW